MFRLAAALALSVALSACAGTDPSPEASPEPSPTTASPSPTAEPSPTAAPTVPPDTPIGTELDECVADDCPTPEPTEQATVYDGELERVHPVPFEDATVDGSQVTVWWWSGVEPCVALEAVHADVDEDSELVTVTVTEGVVPSDEPVACVQMAVRKTFTVDVETDVDGYAVVDGADAD